MERIVYVQEDHFEIPEKLLKLSHEELRKRIDEERKKRDRKEEKTACKDGKKTLVNRLQCKPQ